MFYFLSFWIGGPRGHLPGPAFNAVKGNRLMDDGDDVYTEAAVKETHLALIDQPLVSVCHILNDSS